MSGGPIEKRFDVLKILRATQSHVVRQRTRCDYYASLITRRRDLFSFKR